MGVDVKKILLAFLPYLLALGVLFALWKSIGAVLRDSAEWGAWQADTARTFDSVEVHRMIHDTVEALNRQDSLKSAKLVAVAERNERLLAVSRGTLQALTDSLALLPPPTDTSVWLDVQLRRIETLQGSLSEALAANEAWKAAYASQSLSLQRLTISEKQAWGDIDSLQSLVRRVPKGCTVLGVIRCPVPVLGVGVTSQGFGGFVGIAVPLR